MKEQPYTSQMLNDPSVQHTGAQFSFFNRMQRNENTKRVPGNIRYKENN